MNKKEVKKAPALRFKGFTNDWEQRELIEILKSPVTDGPHETPQILKKGVPFISVEAIVNNKIDFNRKRGYISFSYNAQCNKKYRPQKKDVLLVKSGSTVGKVAVVETNTIFNIWSPLAALRVTNSNDPYFLYYLLQTNTLQRQIINKSKGGTQPNLSMRILEQFKIFLPQNYLNQQKIEQLLRALDKCISLQQRKLKLLKAIKFYLLNQFLLNNNKWPKKKFGNLVNINRGLTYHPFDVVNSDGIRVLRSSNIKDSRIRFNKDDVFVRTSIVKEKYQLKKNDILVTAANGSSNLIGKHALMTKNIPNQVGGFMFSIETNEPHFIFACLESNWFKKLIHKSTTGGNGALGNLKGKDIKNAWIHIPERKIRERIGELEKNIDNFIDYNQKIVNKLIKFKQFLLQNMFI